MKKVLIVLAVVLFAIGCEKEDSVKTDDLK